MGPSRNDRKLTENDPAQPVSHYGKSKLEAELAAREYFHYLPISIARPPSVYGPREKDVFGLFKFTKQGWLPFLGGGPRYVSLIYAKDLVKGLLLIAQSEVSRGQTYFLCNDDIYSWEEVADTVAQLLARKPHLIKIPLPLAFLASCGFDALSKLIQKPTLFSIDKYKDLKERYWVCDNSKAKRELGFQISYSLVDGFKETAEWYLANGWI